MRQLLESLSREQSRNQELLASLGFALRSFTNLNRFLELVPLVSARLVGAEGSLLVPFHADGRLWKEQFQASPPERSHDLLRQLISLADQPRAHHSPANQPPVEGAAEEAVALRLDRDVGMLLGETQVFGTSVVARNLPVGDGCTCSAPARA